MYSKTILITGKPGTGKTTLVRTLCSRLEYLNPTGFYTAEIRIQGKRQGFELIALNGQRMTLAHTSLQGQFRVGKYLVDVAGFEAFLDGLDLQAPGAGFVVIDEIGKMECFSGKFVQYVNTALKSYKPLVATVAAKGGGFISVVKSKPGVELVELTEQNRDQLLEDLEQHLVSRAG